MFLTAALTLAGAVLLGLAARRDEKNPLFVLGGLGLVGVSVFLHVFGPTPWLEVLGYASAELGAGCLVIAGMLSSRNPNARSWFAIGAAGVACGIAIIVVRYLFFSPSVSVLVELGPDDSFSEIEGVVLAHHGVAEQAFPTVDLAEDEDLAQVYLIRLPRRYLDRLRDILRLDTENVDHLELNLSMSLDLPEPSATAPSGREEVLENDPLVGRQWALEAVHAHEAHALLKDLRPSRKARLAILDTGVDARHEDIARAFVESPGSVDRNGHGSHCAGIAGAVTNNGVGVASLNWEGRFIEILSFPAIDANGTGSIESTAQAIIDAAKAGVHVISMSLGTQAPSIPKTLQDAVDYARRNGIVIVAAAGNENRSAMNHVPSNVDGVIAVGAVDEQLVKAGFSNTTEGLSRRISAPGVNILSLKPNGGYVLLSGTSMATPMVSGLIAVMLSLNPDLTDASVFAILRESGRTTPASAGIGEMIDAEGAIKRVLGG